MADTFQARLRAALKGTLVKEKPDWVGLASQTLTTSAVLAVTHDAVFSTVIGEAVGQFTQKVTQQLIVPPAPSDVVALETPYPVIGIAAYHAADMTSGYFCFALAMEAHHTVQPTIAHIFPPFFGRQEWAALYAQQRHPLYIEQPPEASRLTMVAHALWLDQLTPTAAFSDPITPWIVAQLHQEPDLYGAWRQTLTAHGPAIEVLSPHPDHPEFTEPSLTRPPFFARDPQQVRHAIRDWTATAPIPDFLYLPSLLHDQLTWSHSPRGELQVDRTVIQPRPIVASPVVSSPRFIAPVPLRDMADHRPAWYVEATPHDALLWTPVDHGFVLGGYYDDQHQWAPYQFAHADQAFQFLATQGQWSQQHPSLALNLPVLSRALSAPPRSPTL